MILQAKFAFLLYLQGLITTDYRGGGEDGDGMVGGGGWGVEVKF